MSQIELISECFVRPQTEVGEAKRVYHLGPLELSMLSVNYIQAGFLFAKPNNYSPESHLSKLRDSLSKAIVLFFPLAGQLVTTRYETEHSCCIHVDCTKGAGVKLIHALARNVSVYDVMKHDSDVPEVIRSFFDLGEVSVNHDGHTRPLMSVQVTVLVDGVFLGFCFNQSVVDGTSVMRFLRIWSDIFMGMSVLTKMSLPLIQKPEFLDRKIIRLPYLEPDEFIIRDMTKSQLRERFFNFSPKSLQKLKVKANGETGDPASSLVSSFQALTGLVWRCITQARKVPLDEVTTCALPVNLRPRFKPSLTEGFFGNYYVQVKSYATVAALSVNGVGWAATLLKQAVIDMDDKEARGLISRAIDDGPKMILPTLSARSSNVIVGGSARFDVHEPKFGLGRLVAFRGGYVNKLDGKVNAYPGSGGDGVDLEICLAVDTMNALLLDDEFMSFVSHHDGHHHNLVSRM